jgi:ion channel
VSASAARKTKTRRPIRETPFWRAYNASRYTILFYALLLTLLIMPIASTIGLPKIFIRLLLGTCLLAAVMPNATKRTRIALFSGVTLLIAARLVSESNVVPVNPGILLAVVGITGLAAAGATLRFVVVTKQVDHQVIYAALSTYLLAGVFFGQIYWSIERLRPGSLVGPDPTTELTSLYYSFVTLATLGYGDFLPRTDISRGVATFEVIGGQLYLAVMVARLIGLFVPKNEGA